MHYLIYKAECMSIGQIEKKEPPLISFSQPKRAGFMLMKQTISNIKTKMYLKRIRKVIKNCEKRYEEINAKFSLL